MPTQNLYKSQETQLGPNTVEQYVGNDVEYIARKTAEFGEAASAAINTSTLNKAEGALELGEYQREQDATQGAEAYKRKLYEAASVQDEETFGKLYAEAQRIRTATEQGIMSPSTAQLRMSKLEKDMAYAHPHLAGQLRAAVSGVSGNASQLLKMAQSDPATKAMEEIFAKAMEQGRTPAQYMSLKRRESDVELAKKELDYAAAYRTHTSQEYEAQYSTYLSGDTQVKVRGFFEQLQQKLRGAGGTIPGADARAAILDYKKNLYDMRMREINTLVEQNPGGIDRLRMVAVVEQDLAYIDDLAAGFLQGSSFTLEHAKGMLDYQDKAFELGKKREFEGLKALFPPVYARVFEEQPATLVKWFTSAAEAAAAGKIHPGFPMSPEFIKENSDAAIGYSMIEDMKKDPNRAAILKHLFGSSVDLFFGPGGAGPAPTGDRELDSMTADNMIRGWSDMTTPQSRQDGAVRLLRSRVTTSVKLATSGNDGLLTSIRSNPEAVRELDKKVIEELALTLMPNNTPEYIAQIQMGGDSNRPIQYATGSTPGSGLNKAIDDANTILRAYAVINPRGYSAFRDQFEAMVFPKAPKEQGSAK